MIDEAKNNQQYNFVLLEGQGMLRHYQHAAAYHWCRTKEKHYGKYYSSLADVGILIIVSIGQQKVIHKVLWILIYCLC